MFGPLELKGNKSSIAKATRRAKCSLCGLTLNGKAINNLISHLQSTHCEVLAYNRLSAAFMKKNEALYTQALEDKKHKLILPGEDNEVDGKSNKKRKASHQSSLPFAVESCSTSIIEGLPEAFATCIALGKFPTSLSENPGIKFLLNYLIPNKKVGGLSQR